MKVANAAVQFRYMALGCEGSAVFSFSRSNRELEKDTYVDDGSLRAYKGNKVPREVFRKKKKIGLLQSLDVPLI